MKSADPKQLILWAEDDDNDALLFERAIESADPSCSMLRVKDGEEAVRYLQGDGKYADRTKHPLPRLLLLDIKMPRRTGFEVLEWKRSQPALNAIPAVVLSSSFADSDRARAKALGACGFFSKPAEAAKIRLVIKSLTDIAVNQVQ
jgi:CheY-like chemotaxis protein